MEEYKDKIRNIIKTILNERLKDSWYHGTPDKRDIESKSGFSKINVSVDYIDDIQKYEYLQNKLKETRESGDENSYFKYLDMVPSVKKIFSYAKPLFLTNNFSVAKTYANPKRAFDYQDAEEKVYKLDVKCNKNVTINANGDRFRFIGIDKVKRGFMDAGISETEIDKLISMFNYYIPDNKGIKTDVICAIGNFLKFDCIDVKNVYDSYHGGNIKSTVKIVLDTSNVKIVDDKHGLKEPILESDNKLKPYEKLLINAVIDFFKEKWNFDANITIKKTQNNNSIGYINLNPNSVYHNKFVLYYNPNCSFNYMIISLIHELTHIKQVSKKQLKPSDDWKSIIWNDDFLISIKEYNEISKNFNNKYIKLPWEVEADKNMRDSNLFKEFKLSKQWNELKGKDATLDFIIDNS